MIQIVYRANSLDTLKWGIPYDDIDVDLDTFRDVKLNRTSGITTYTTSPDTIGITQINAIPDINLVTVETSAKLLGMNYKHGVCLDTFEQYIDGINGTGIIKVNPQDIFDNADIYKADGCQTIELSRTPATIVKALQLLNNNGKYVFTAYPKGLTVTRKAKSRTDRGNIYAKRDELNMFRNKAFRDKYPAVLDTFTDKDLRIEHQLRSLKDIRTAYGVNDTKVVSILTADVNPVHDYFKNISNDYNKTLARIASMKDTRNIKEKMIVAMALGYDLDKIMTTLFSNTKGNNGRDKRIYRDVIARAKALETSGLGYDALINEVEKKLSQAV